MVAYNFQKRFEPMIRSGAKSHTIRKNGKRKHAKPGQMLQLYTGMRTQYCRKICPDRPCVEVLPVRIMVARLAIDWIEVGDERVKDMEAFAVSDGFDGLASMHTFWLDFRGIGLFSDASLIKWLPPEETSNDE